jgi:steroid delta-isomerase-like uncharacterized protein
MTALASTETRSRAQLFREVFALLNKRDANALLPYWAEDVVEEFPTGKVVGREAVRQYFEDVFNALPDFRIEPLTIAVEGDQVFIRWHMSGTLKGKRWMGIDPTGHKVELDGIDCFTVKNDKITHNFVVYDQISFARQIGLLPPLGSALDRAMLAAFNLKTKVAARLR